MTTFSVIAEWPGPYYSVEIARDLSLYEAELVKFSSRKLLTHVSDYCSEIPDIKLVEADS
jgi:hypothetical protein